MKANSLLLDKIQGGLLGGAVGDALGYPVEFMSWREIQKEYGQDGIQKYDLDFETGAAIFSDDTQMSLFTANGILLGETQRRLKGAPETILSYVHTAYMEWLKTQDGKKDLCWPHRCWLYEILDLHCSREPGATCLSALRSGKMGSVDVPLNHSKGCGGVMRVAPLALHCEPASSEELKRLDMDAAEIAAITHGHPLGYLPAAILSHIISVGVYGDETKTLRETVGEAWTTVKEMFRAKAPDADLTLMESLITKAGQLSEAAGTDEEHIRALGQGWTGDEALAIAIYCSLRYPNDFSKAVIASVNHSGDSDSTGAVTGNLLGAWLGYNAIEEKWKRNLEMLGVILEMAEDLCPGREMDESWLRKYGGDRAG